MNTSIYGYHDYCDALGIVENIKDKEIKKLVLSVLLPIKDNIRHADKAIQVEFTGVGWSNFIPGFYVDPNAIFVDGDEIPRLGVFNKKNLKTLAFYFDFYYGNVDMLGHELLEKPVGFQGIGNLKLAIEWLKRS